MNPYNTPASSRPWWKTTPAAFGMLVLVALLGALSFPLGFLVMIAAMVAMWVLPPWRWFAKLGATFGAFVLLTVGASLGGQLDDNGKDKSDAKVRNEKGTSAEATSSSPSPKPLKIADYTGKQLDEAAQQA